MKPIFFVLLVGIIAGMPQLSLAQTQAPAPPTAAPAPPAPSAANPGPPAAPTPAPDGAPVNPAPASANQAPAAATQPAGPIYVVTYFEVAPASARKTANLLRSFVVAARKEDGNSEFTALHEVGRPGRFALVEAWRDKAALDAH
ncbi:MAG TPA: antibiotic biosynthesis monooxygenase family protein, partial [Stellaceae bacterium]|nr:antibiotic biosynthesis monooxygenase family protein [Stellaceae bacterium]